MTDKQTAENARNVLQTRVAAGAIRMTVTTMKVMDRTARFHDR